MIVYRQSEKIHVSQLLVPDKHWPSEQRFIGERNGVRPEMVMRRRTEVAKALSYLGGRCRQRGVSGVAEYTNAPVDGDGTGRPSAPLIQSEPTMGIFVVHMHGIEQGNENIDVQKSDAHALIPQCVHKL